MALVIRNVFFVICVFAFIITASATESSRPRRNVNTCGVPRNPIGLIIRGKDIRRGEFPWIVALMYTGKESTDFFCGGTLISSTFVLSVAHCFLEKHSTEILSAQNIRTIFGVQRLNDPYEVERIVLIPDEIIIHDEWDPRVTSYDADISLLKFEGDKININHAYIHPICIWDSIDDPFASEGLIMGWGKSEDSQKVHETVPKLTKISIQYIDDCLVETPALAELSSNRTFCAGNKNGSGVCFGDSGGGLFIKIDGIHYLRGLISSSLLKDAGCDTTRYAIYTNIHKFIDWIQQKTRGAFSTSAKALNDVFCRLQLQFSYHYPKRIPTCVIEQTIGSDFFVIGSEHNASVLGFAIHDKQDTKYLPRFIGEKFPNLEEIAAFNCSFSIVRSFYFDEMRNVRYMDFSFNQIEIIEKRSFKHLSSVKYLYLGNNRIDTFDKDLFKAMVNLMDLDLSHNRINSLDPRTFKISGGKLLEVNLLSNDCINGNYEEKDFIHLERSLRNDCQL